MTQDNHPFHGLYGWDISVADRLAVVSRCNRDQLRRILDADASIPGGLQSTVKSAVQSRLRHLQRLPTMEPRP